MRTQLLHNLVASAFAIGASVTSASARIGAQPEDAAQIGFITIDQEITLRRLVISNRNPKGTVLFLHGFPETLYAWEHVARPLAADYEIHAFDWPGYGLSSRPEREKFSYTPRDYARILRKYIAKAGIEKAKLTIYATDIGALPALLLALDEPRLARKIIVGDFAPFDRPGHMYQSLQSLKSPTSAEQTRIYMNSNRDEILANAFTRGLPDEERFAISGSFKDDISRGWNHGAITSADAFHHYYSAFTRDQNYLEANLARLKTPVKVIWGEKDLYINKAMGIEFAKRVNSELTVLPGIGHYPHLQDPSLTIMEVQASFR